MGGRGADGREAERYEERETGCIFHILGKEVKELLNPKKQAQGKQENRIGVNEI